MVTFSRQHAAETSSLLYFFLVKINYLDWFKFLFLHGLVTCFDTILDFWNPIHYFLKSLCPFLDLPQLPRQGLQRWTWICPLSLQEPSQVFSGENIVL